MLAEFLDRARRSLELALYDVRLTGDPADLLRGEKVTPLADSPPLAARFAEDFEQLWTTREVQKSGRVASDAVDGVRPWFCPGRGEALAHRIAHALGAAKQRVRIASPVITSG